MLQLPETPFAAENKANSRVSSEAPDKLKEEGALCGLPRALERKEAGEKQAPLTDTQKFEKKHGVTVETRGDKHVYILKVNGQDKELLTTDANAKGIEKAEAELVKLRNEKMAELTKTFKVTFALEGEDVIKQWIQKDDCSWERGGMIKSRSANLAELHGIEAALYKAQPSQLTKGGGDGVKFYFLSANYYKGDPALAYFIQQDRNNHQAVYFEPGANDGKPITEADADRMGKHHLYSIEAVTHHELMHNAQHNSNWNTASVKEKWARKLGWMPFEDPRTHETKWIFTGKQSELYRRDQDHCKDEFKWCACGKHGGLQDAEGDAVSKVKEAKHFTLDQIRDLAAVKPSTRYFVNPLEMFAEGGMKYRVNEKRRTELLQDSPRLYDAVKEHDQDEITLRYGKAAGGEPNYVRSVSGKLVKNTPEARAEIAAFEERIRNPEKKK